MVSLDEFLSELSSAEPVPGGGSVAALEASLGASLLVMVANLTIGKKKYAEVQGRVEELRAAAVRLRDRARELMQSDADAYGAVHTAMKLPKETDAEADTRRRGIQEALKGAALPPMETMQVAADVVKIALPLSEIGNRSAISDVGSAALAAQAAFHSAKLNVEINVESVHDEAWVAAMRKTLDELSSPDSDVETILARVNAVIRGEQV